MDIEIDIYKWFPLITWAYEIKIISMSQFSKLQSSRLKKLYFKTQCISTPMYIGTYVCRLYKSTRKIFKNILLKNVFVHTLSILSNF